MKRRAPLIGLRRDLDRAGSWLEAVPDEDRDSEYWLVRANIALIGDDPDAARLALQQARAIVANEPPNHWKKTRASCNLYNNWCSTKTKPGRT